MIERTRYYWSVGSMAIILLSLNAQAQGVAEADTVAENDMVAEGDAVADYSSEVAVDTLSVDLAPPPQKHDIVSSINLGTTSLL